MKYKKNFEAKIGEFYEIAHYDKVINESSVGYKEDGSLLFCLIKGNVPEDQRLEFKYNTKCKSNKDEK